MAGPTYDYFGGSPVEVLFQTSTTFNGVAFAPGVIATITPGLAIFPSQAGGGRLDFHLRPLKVDRISYTGAGALTTTFVLPDGTTELTVPDLPFSLPPGCALKFVSTGAGKVLVSAREIQPGTSLT